MGREKCMNRDHQSLRRNKKTLPYGATRGRYWCFGCDAARVPSWSKPIKKRERQKAKKQCEKPSPERKEPGQ